MDAIEETTISPEEWTEISSQLEIHHALFYQLWQMGKPLFDKSIPTAAVRFNPEGQLVEFVFNPDFWNELTLTEKKFVICHESLHVIFNHGLRMINTKQGKKCNVAMDIIVNHSLVDNFGFKRSDLSMEAKLCWMDTVFKPEIVAKIPTRQTFEFYYLLLKDPDNLAEGNQPSDADGSGGAGGLPETLDDHSQLPGMSNQDWGEVVKKLDETLSNEEKSGIKDLVEKHTQLPKDQKPGKGRGTQGMGAWHFVSKDPVKKKKKWETVIKKWSKKFLKKDIASIEQWARMARRFALLPTNLMLPSEVDNDSWSQDRIQVWFFQDCSGSCIGLKDRFFRAAKSLPKERFDVKMHTFDTRVFEVDINQGKVRGGGGTSFTCMEQYIQQYMKKHKVSYPKAVFIITDGMGNNVRPQQPENWYWFLSYNYRYCIPKESQIFMLNEFE